MRAIAMFLVISALAIAGILVVQKFSAPKGQVRTPSTGTTTRTDQTGKAFSDIFDESGKEADRLLREASMPRLASLQRERLTQWQLDERVAQVNDSLARTERLAASTQQAAEIAGRHVKTTELNAGNAERSARVALAGTKAPLIISILTVLFVWLLLRRRRGVPASTTP